MLEESVVQLGMDWLFRFFQNSIQLLFIGNALFGISKFFFVLTNFVLKC
jgi:hypothetical protein